MLISHVEETDSQPWKGYVLSIFLFMSATITTIFLQNYALHFYCFAISVSISIPYLIRLYFGHLIYF